MNNVSDAMPERRTVSEGETLSVQIVFATDYPSNPNFIIEPYGSNDGPTIIVET